MNTNHEIRVNSREKGQILPILAVGFIVLVALVGFAVDLAIWDWKNNWASEVADIACTSAAQAARRGEDAQLAWERVLTANGISEEKFSPEIGENMDSLRGLDFDGVSWWSALNWERPTSFLQLVGQNSMPILAQERCLGIGGGNIAPVIVKESAIYGSIDGTGPEEYTILGRDPKWDLADKESGTNFRGAVFLHMWCIPSTDPNCPDIRIFDPLDEKPPSAQTQKKLIENCFAGINCRIQPEVGQRLPIISGTSNKQLCKAFQKRWNVGDYVPVMVFPGEIHSPDPTFGNWENAPISGFAVYEVTAFEPNAKNCNHVKAKLASPKIYSSQDEIPDSLVTFKSRGIPWDYQGPLP